MTKRRRQPSKPKLLGQGRDWTVPSDAPAHLYDAAPVALGHETAAVIIAAPDCDSLKGRATKSLRDDPLGRLHVRNQITECQYAAGHYMQQMFELVGYSGVRAMDFSKPAVDCGGQGASPLTDSMQRAATRLREARAELGARGFQLVREVLAERTFIEQVALARGETGERAIRFYSRLFRECLDSVADVYGFSVEGKGKRQPKDAHSLNAVNANHPELHRAIRAARETRTISPSHRIGASPLSLPAKGVV